MSAETTTWEELAQREFLAAKVGYTTWANFVAEAERITCMPWDEIRDRLNEIHKRDGLPPPGLTS